MTPDRRGVMILRKVTLERNPRQFYTLLAVLCEPFDVCRFPNNKIQLNVAFVKDANPKKP